MEQWYKFLSEADENRINIERVESLKDNQNDVLKYVLRTLSFADSFDTKNEGFFNTCVIRALQWCEVSKCGSRADREKWMASGYPLDIHNEASAEIYKTYSEDDALTTLVVYTLIKTHGLIGQYLRGEVALSVNAPLCELISKDILSPSDLYHMLLDLNKAIISGVSEDLWKKVKSDVTKCIIQITNCEIYECEDTFERMAKLFPAFDASSTPDIDAIDIFNDVFKYCDLWYPYAALNSFSKEEIKTIFKLIVDSDLKNIKHITFYDFSKNMNYDYEGKRSENIYKKRIIERFLKDLAEGTTSQINQHLSVDIKKTGDTLSFNIKFTKVCEALINFCVEAERSGFIEYQKNILTVFDLFGFRKDIFDRLNNEDSYLATMDAADNSTKYTLLDYVAGNKITDVGSGSGVLVKKLIEKYPEKEITATDVSTCVIEKLEKLAKSEDNAFNVKLHNFVDGRLTELQDTIIFSSILHEIYSYTDTGFGKFSIHSVKSALANAKDSLNPGGRIVIRDGVKCHENKISSVTFNTKEGVDFIKSYINDFKGLVGMDREQIKLSNKTKTSIKLTAPIDFIREALYTYTWGVESYAQEVQEQFGYFTFDDYKSFLESIGLEIEYASVFTEKGYIDHLSDKVTLDCSWEDLPSNCIIVAKRK